MNRRVRIRFPALLRVIACWVLLLMSTHSLASDLSIQLLEEGWGDAAVEDVESVLRAAAEPLWKAAGAPPLPLIRVEPTGGPIVLHRRGSDGSICVRLAVEGGYWAQMAYQFSHEFAHILFGFTPEHQSHQWIEEAARETASLFSLRHMARSWSQDENLKRVSYAPHLKSYADQLMEKSRLKSPTDFPAWFRSHAQEIQADLDDRELLKVIALQWLPLLEEDPRGWRGLRYLNHGIGKIDEELPELFQRWRKHCPEVDREQVDRVVRLFIGESKESEQSESRPAQS